MMNMPIFLLCLVLLGLNVSTAMAGGAVAAQKRKTAVQQSIRQGQGPHINMHVNVNPGQLTVPVNVQGTASGTIHLNAGENMPVPSVNPQPVPEVQLPSDVLQSSPKGSSQIPVPESVSMVSEQVAEEIDPQNLNEHLAASGQAWALIIHVADKKAVVEYFIEDYRQKGVIIHKPAVQYVQMIDQMAQGDSHLLNMPFARILQIVAVMEYDFDNGQDKDAMAYKILGPQVYAKNKARLGGK